MKLQPNQQPVGPRTSLLRRLLKVLATRSASALPSPKAENITIIIHLPDPPSQPSTSFDTAASLAANDNDPLTSGSASS